MLSGKLGKKEWEAFSRKFASYLQFGDEFALRVIAAKGDKEAMFAVFKVVCTHLDRVGQAESKDYSFDVSRFLLQELIVAKRSTRNVVRQKQVVDSFGSNIKLVIREGLMAERDKMQTDSVAVLSQADKLVKKTAAKERVIVLNSLDIVAPHTDKSKEAAEVLSGKGLLIGKSEYSHDQLSECGAKQLRIRQRLNQGVRTKLDKFKASDLNKTSFDVAEKKSEVRNEGVVFPVWYATNRKLESSKKFCSERNSTLTYGKVGVLVPKTHRYGEIGTSIFKRLARLSFADDKLIMRSNDILTQDEFWRGINVEHQAYRDGERPVDALIFIHGYNVSFENAAIRAAQLGCDLKINGVTSFYSWPSKGAIDGYLSDAAAIEASEKFISDYLVNFVRKSGADRVNIIAHSMGNRGLLRALQRIGSSAEIKSEFKLNQIFLAAPDIDRDLFIDMAHLYGMHSCRTTLYASPADMALHLSSEIHKAPRAGYYHPYTVASGVDTIGVPDFDLDFLGHGYFAQAEALLTDIFTLITSDTDPSKRPRLLSEKIDGSIIWKFAR